MPLNLPCQTTRGWVCKPLRSPIVLDFRREFNMAKLSDLDARFASLHIQRTKEAAKRMILIAIDFGTTFSSIATVRLANRDLHDEEGEPIPTSQVKTQEKYLVLGIEKKRYEVPSVLAYDKSTGEPYFGLEVEAATRKGLVNAGDELDLIKLLLRPENIPAEKYKIMKSKISRIRRKDLRTNRRSQSQPTATQLISDCLLKLFSNAVWRLKMQYTEVGVNESAIHVVLCIPAIWEDRERLIMTDAAALASLPEPYFVSEPEGAAGLYFAETGDDLEVSILLQSPNNARD